VVENMKQFFVVSFVIFVSFCCGFPVEDFENTGERLKAYDYKYLVKDEDKQLFMRKTEMGDTEGKKSNVFHVFLRITRVSNRKSYGRI
jgi:hypothetical protein